MKHSVVAGLAGLAAVVALAGCETSGEASAPAAGNAPEAAGRAACLRDVRAQTGNPVATVLSSSFSEAGTEVIVGIGPQRAQWRCIAYRDGTTAGIESLTDEGAL
jgi:ABC-type phosphate transport system substrate-binding protein